MVEQSLPISIIITNYNYGTLIKAAIDSALAVDWPEKEIIVVDDGSTDCSLDVIKGYGDHIQSITKTNGGQNSAANAGFAKSKGAIVFFLDADDMLASDVARRVIPLFDEHTAKVQFPLTWRASGGAHGGLYPRFPKRYSPADVRRSIASTGFYVSSPTSGNAWARWVLEQTFPLPTRWSNTVVADYFDGYLSTIAARLGDIVTLQEPLGTYYINPNNMWSKHFSPKLIAERCEEDFARTEYINSRLRSLCLAPIKQNGFTHWMKRLVYRKYYREVYPIEETAALVLLRSLNAAVMDPGLAIKNRMLVMGWMLSVAALPRQWALPLIKLKFVPGYRPKLVRWLLEARG